MKVFENSNLVGWTNHLQKIWVELKIFPNFNFLGWKFKESLTCHHLVVIFPNQRQDYMEGLPTFQRVWRVRWDPIPSNLPLLGCRYGPVAKWTNQILDGTEIVQSADESIYEFSVQFKTQTRFLWANLENFDPVNPGFGRQLAFAMKLAYVDHVSVNVYLYVHVRWVGLHWWPFLCL